MGAGRGLGVRQEGTTQSLLLTRKEMREMPFLGTSRWQRGGARMDRKLLEGRVPALLLHAVLGPASRRGTQQGLRGRWLTTALPPSLQGLRQALPAGPV